MCGSMDSPRGPPLRWRPLPFVLFKNGRLAHDLQELLMAKTRTINTAISVFAKCVIFFVALVFALAAFHTVDPWTDFGHFMRHLGVGMTIFASFMAAYDFT